MKNKLHKVLGIALWVTQVLPCFFGTYRHDCKYDECNYVLSDFKCGMCVEKAIDGLYLTVAILWMFIIVGSCMVLSKTNALSPFVVMAMVIGISIWGALVDPSRWYFVLSLLPSAVLLVVANVVDKKKKRIMTCVEALRERVQNLKE